MVESTALGGPAMKNLLCLFPNFSRAVGLGVLSLLSLVGFLTIDSLWAAEEDKERWNKKYETGTYLFGREPIPFLKDHVALLPKGAVLGPTRNGCAGCTARAPSGGPGRRSACR